MGEGCEVHVPIEVWRALPHELIELLELIADTAEIVGKIMLLTGRADLAEVAAWIGGVRVVIDRDSPPLRV